MGKQLRCARILHRSGRGWRLGDRRLKRYGWIDGTDADLGDSHQVSFFKFHLNQDSLVNITMTGANPTGLNPAFTLYAGLMGDEAHDDTALIRSIL
jgi:hypothetical protein